MKLISAGVMGMRRSKGQPELKADEYGLPSKQELAVLESVGGIGSHPPGVTLGVDWSQKDDPGATAATPKVTYVDIEASVFGGEPAFVGNLEPGAAVYFAPPPSIVLEAAARALLDRDAERAKKQTALREQILARRQGHY